MKGGGGGRKLEWEASRRRKKYDEGKNTQSRSISHKGCTEKKKIKIFKNIARMP